MSKHFFSRRFLSVRLKSLKNDLWVPEKQITIFKLNGEKKQMNVLVDSGADTTFIPYELGIEIGFKHNSEDILKEASGVGSQVPYLEKALRIQIDDKIIKIPVCWCLNPLIDDFLLGREGIFSIFKVSFDEKQRSVIFEPYESTVS